MSLLEFFLCSIFVFGAVNVHGVASNVCNVEGTRLSCKNRGLTQIPAAEIRNSNADILDLSDNRISSINASDLTSNARILMLNNNRIDADQVNDKAFVAMPNLRELYLQENHLRALPNAIASIQNLTVLDVRDNVNPRDHSSISINDNIAKAIGDTLQVFLFGNERIRTWPASLSHFQDLHELTLDTAGPELDVIPPSAFHSFESTLKILTIKNTHLVSVPIGVSNIRFLREFYFDYNPLTGDKGMIMQAFFRQNSSIEVLSLRGDHLTTFPRALRYLPSLRRLDMSDNDLVFVSDDVVHELKANQLILSNCNIHRVPGALTTMKNLTYLDLSTNKIITLENNDLSNMNHLQDLILDNNDISFVSNDAFINVTTLRRISLREANLTEIPLAFQFFYPPLLEKADLSGNDITCMCKYSCMAYEICQKDRNKCPVTNASPITGDCGNIVESINNYFRNYIGNCPQYQALQARSITCPRITESNRR